MWAAVNEPWLDYQSRADSAATAEVENCWAFTLSTSEEASSIAN